MILFASQLHFRFFSLLVNIRISLNEWMKEIVFGVCMLFVFYPVTSHLFLLIVIIIIAYAKIIADGITFLRALRLLQYTPWYSIQASMVWVHFIQKNRQIGFVVIFCFHLFHSVFPFHSVFNFDCWFFFRFCLHFHHPLKWLLNDYWKQYATEEWWWFFLRLCDVYITHEWDVLHFNQPSLSVKQISFFSLSHQFSFLKYYKWS